MKHKLLLFVLLTASLPIFATGSIKERLSPNETLWFTYPIHNIPGLESVFILTRVFFEKVFNK